MGAINAKGTIKREIKSGMVRMSVKGVNTANKTIKDHRKDEIKKLQAIPHQKTVF